jgi:chromosome segregation ATPase
MHPTALAILKVALFKAAFVSLAPLVLVACSTPGYKKADSAADTTRSADQAAIALLGSAQNAQTYLASLQQGELKPIFARFEKEVDAFDGNRKRLRGAIEDLRKGTNGYIDELQKTSEAITSADLTAKVHARIANISKQLSDIDGYASGVDSAADEVAGELADLRNFLRADLSMRAVEGSAASRSELDASVTRLGSAIDALKRELAEVQAALASGS